MDVVKSCHQLTWVQKSVTEKKGELLVSKSLNMNS